MKFLARVQHCIVFATLFALISNPAFGQQSNRALSKTAEEERRQKLFGQILSILPQHKIPPAFAAARQPLSDIKCGTAIMAQAQLQFDLFTTEQQDVIRTALARPSLPLSHVTPSGEFRIHYATSGPDAVSTVDFDQDNIPDYIEEVAAAFDSSFNLQLNILNYLKPPSDDGVDGPEYDIYVEALPTGFYGLTTTDGEIVTTPGNDRVSFIRVDNDFMNGQFTQGLDGARVTAAHEYFHAVQFGYRTALVNNDFWYYELCSTWMEDVAYDDIDDYYSTVPQYYRRSGDPFNLFDQFSLYNYGASVWYHFLMKKYADPKMVRRTWEIMRDQVNISQGTVIDALKQTLFENSRSLRFEEEFAEFSVWNYFTNTRSDPVKYYEEGSEYPSIRQQQSLTVSDTTVFPVTVVDSSLSASHNYYTFTMLTADENFGLAVSVDEPDKWRFATIVSPPQGSPLVQLFRPGANRDLGLIPQFSEITVVPINVRTISGAESLRLRSERSTFLFNLFKSEAQNINPVVVKTVYPNPYRMGSHPDVKLEFEVATLIDTEVRVISSAGTVLRTIRFNEQPDAFQQGSDDGTWQVVWDGTDEESRRVASGVYILQLRQADLATMKKIAVIRE